MHNQNNPAARLCALGCIALLAMTAACKKQEDQGAAAMMMGGTPEVEVYQVREQMLLPQVELPGRTSAYRVAEVRPQVSGILQKRLFAEGSEVREGQLLYQIDPALYQAAVASAEAQLAQAEATEHSTRKKAERYRALVKTRAVSAQDQVEMEAAWKQASAAVAAAKAALETARINLNYTRVKAPISGRIGKSNVTEGALMTAQQAGALAVIQQLDPLYVDVNQPADDMLSLREKMGGRRSGGEAARVRVFLANGRELGQEGRLEFSDVTVDQGTGTVTIRAIVPNPGRELLPGMFIRARLTSQVPAPTLLVPQAALTRTQRGEEMVYVVDRASKVELRLIKTSRNEGQMAVVTDGLQPGEHVVVQGLQKIRPEMQVKVVPGKDAGPAGAQPGVAPAQPGPAPAQGAAQTPATKSAPATPTGPANTDKKAE